MKTFNKCIYSNDGICNPIVNKVDFGDRFREPLYARIEGDYSVYTGVQVLTGTIIGLPSVYTKTVLPPNNVEMCLGLADDGISGWVLTQKMIDRIRSEQFNIVGNDLEQFRGKTCLWVDANFAGSLYVQIQKK